VLPGFAAATLSAAAVRARQLAAAGEPAVLPSAAADVFSHVAATTQLSDADPNAGPYAHP
jgi:hypothetical protein